MGNTLQQLGSAIALSVALAGAPNTASAQVSEATRAKVMELQKDPAFKLKGSAKKCISGELVDPICESLVKGQADGFQSNQELIALQAEKSRLDAEKSRLDAEKSRLDAEIVVQSHVGGAIFLVDTMNYALFQTPENNLRQEYLKKKLPDNVTQFITQILRKVDSKQPITKEDIRTFESLFEEHTKIARKLLGEHPEISKIKAGEYLERILIAYATIKPKIDAKIG